MPPGKHRQIDPANAIQELTAQLEKVKAGIRARVVKRWFGHVKVRYRGLAKNSAQLHTLSDLGNLWLVRRKLVEVVA